MEYKLKLPAIIGEIVPLSVVAEAMALRDATAGGTPYHEPAFEGRLTGHILALLEEVRSGRLEVCNTFGSPLPIDSSIDATKHFGYAKRHIKEPDWERLRRENPPIGDGGWDLSHIDLGPMEIDKTKPHIFWVTKLKMLNEWAVKRGDLFLISHDGVGWCDERGYVVPTSQDTKMDGSAEDATSKRVVIESTSKAWITSARNLAIGIVEHQKRPINQNRLAELVHAAMKKKHWNGEQGMTGRGGRVPGIASIRRHALKGIKMLT